MFVSFTTIKKKTIFVIYQNRDSARIAHSLTPKRERNWGRQRNGRSEKFNLRWRPWIQSNRQRRSQPWKCPSISSLTPFQAFARGLDLRVHLLQPTWRQSASQSGRPEVLLLEDSQICYKLTNWFIFFQKQPQTMISLHLFSILLIKIYYTT